MNSSHKNNDGRQNNIKSNNNGNIHNESRDTSTLRVQVPT